VPVGVTLTGMADVEFEQSQSLSRADAAKLLASLSEALGGDEEHAHLRLGDSTVTVRVPEHVRAEVEIEVDGDELELEIELTWSLAAHQTRRPRSAKEASS
jgi:amphi-Trp domain-containing protein